jgi:hypothetical protein
MPGTQEREETIMATGTEDLKAELTSLGQRIHDFRGRL